MKFPGFNPNKDYNMSSFSLQLLIHSSSLILFEIIKFSLLFYHDFSIISLKDQTVVSKFSQVYTENSHFSDRNLCGVVEPWKILGHCPETFMIFLIISLYITFKNRF
jgi:hypothetical protein